MEKAAECGVTVCYYVGLMSFSDLVEFTDEEGYGKFLDLHECYVKFINLKGIEVPMTVAHC